MKRILVTGLHGFVGRTVESLIFTGAADSRYELVVPHSAIELLDPRSLESAIVQTRPNLVLHLAAQSFVPRSFENPRATFNVNFFGTLNLLEALKAYGFSGRMLYVGSGEVYGWVEPSELPIVETQRMQPRNPYSVSKAASELLCFQWTQTHGLDIVLAWPFNHIGSGQPERFVVSDFAKQIVEIKLGLRDAVTNVGAIDVTRDFTDVRDVAIAYFMLLEGGVKGEVYNVCLGREQTIRSILERLIALAGIECRLTEDQVRIRPNEQRRMCGSHARLSRQTGWQPTIDMDQSLRDVLNYWERELEHA